MHPRWGCHKYIIRCARRYNIEVEPKDVDINTSILSTRYPISLFSTVLYQSHLFGKRIVIDDYCCKGKCDFLKKIDYIAFSFDYMLFSDLISCILEDM